MRADYGVLHTDGAVGATHRVTGYDEKPELGYTVSMGVYVVEPVALEELTSGERCDFPELVLALLARGAAVGSYAFDGYWLDIGREDDFRRAQADADQVLAGLLPQGVRGAMTRVLMIGPVNHPHVEHLALAMHERGLDVIVAGNAEPSLPPSVLAEAGIPVLHAPPRAAPHAGRRRGARPLDPSARPRAAPGRRPRALDVRLRGARRGRGRLAAGRDGLGLGRPAREPAADGREPDGPAPLAHRDGRLAGPARPARAARSAPRDDRARQLGRRPRRVRARQRRRGPRCANGSASRPGR